MQSARLSAPPGFLLAGLALLLLPFSFAPGVCGQTVEVLQSPESVSVVAGGQLILNCSVVTVTGGSYVIGSVQWLKGSGATRTRIYSEKAPLPRISRVSPGAKTDFSIIISNISTADIGTYYCVKFKREHGTEVEHKSGGGTNLSVNAHPSAPILTSPPSRVDVGNKVNFTCTSEGFSPRDITVTWLKDGTEIRASTENIGGSNPSFWVKSTLTVTLRKEDIKSRLTCQIKHNTTTRPLNATHNMSDIIRVSPSVKLQVSPAPTVLVNTSVQITCRVERFYPRNMNITLHVPMKDTVNRIPPEPQTLNDDGTYSATRSLQLNATEQWNQSVFTCKAQHQDKENESESAVRLVVTDHPATEDTPSTLARGDQNQFQYYVIAACLALLLLLVLAVVLFMWTKKKRDKDTITRRSMHSSRTAQALGTKDLTYADLEFQQRPPNQRSTVAQNDHCEYASVQTGAQPRKDNLTYADLDTVQLNQGPKKARPAEVSSEYAEVQIRKQ